MSNTIEIKASEIEKYSIITLKLIIDGYEKTCIGFINQYYQFVPLVNFEYFQFNYKLLYPEKTYEIVITDPFYNRTFYLQSKTHTSDYYIGFTNQLSLNYLNPPISHEQWNNGINNLFLLLVKRTIDDGNIINDYVLAKHPMNTNVDWVVYKNGVGWIEFYKLDENKNTTIIGWVRTRYEEIFEALI